MDEEILDDNIDADDVEAPVEEDALPEDEDDLDDELVADVDLPGAEGDDDAVAVVVADDDDDEDEAPAARRKPAGEDDDDEDEDVDPDDVEADLDAILKDRIAAGTDDDEEEDEVPDSPNDPDVAERVAAKSAEEFTCDTCFMIVHPRQFGRLGRLSCPEGYDPCSSVSIVEKRLKRAAKK